MTKKGFKKECENCLRLMCIPAHGLCGTCNRAAGDLTGEDREQALADARERIAAAKGGIITRQCKPKKYNPTEAELRIIRDLYDGTSTKINIIMMRLGRKYPSWYVRKLAQKMGLARTKEPSWSWEETQYLYENYPRMGLKKLRVGLYKISGFKRTFTAIKLKQKRLGITSHDDDGFTLRGVMQLLWKGQENHQIVHRWINNGWLKGKRRGTLRLARQGGDQWYFSPAWVRSFIIAHPEEIDLRMVDALPFMRLLAGDAETIAQCRCPECRAEYEMTLFNPDPGVNWRYCDACRNTVGDDDSETRYGIAT
jgi:hypothetical protein